MLCEGAITTSQLQYRCSPYGKRCSRYETVHRGGQCYVRARSRAPTCIGVLKYARTAYGHCNCSLLSVLKEFTHFSCSSIIYFKGIHKFQLFTIACFLGVHRFQLVHECLFLEEFTHFSCSLLFVLKEFTHALQLFIHTYSRGIHKFQLVRFCLFQRRDRGSSQLGTQTITATIGSLLSVFVGVHTFQLRSSYSCDPEGSLGPRA